MARLLPLEGKYYATNIELNDGSVITIYTGLSEHVENKASTREIDRGWEPMEGFNHTETQRDLDIAQTIVDALNSKGY